MSNADFIGLVRGVAPMLAVEDLARSLAFYVGRLGFVVVYEQPEIALLEVGSVRLYLVSTSPPTPDRPGVALTPLNRPDASPFNLVFHVADVEAAYRALVAAGVTFLAPPHQPPWGGLRCFARDPDGYVIEIEDMA